MRRKILYLVLGAVVLICFAVGVFFLLPKEEAPKELMLCDYPELFEKDVVIVIGENVTRTESESAEATAENLHNITGNMPAIKNDRELTEGDKAKYNLIIVGTPESNHGFEEIYEITNATRVTEEYPGEGKGILEILSNPWDEDKAMLLVEGSDEWGVKAGTEILRYVGELDKDEVVVDWEHLSENKKAIVLGLTPREFEIIDTTIHEYLYEKYPFLRDTEFGIRYERVSTEVDSITPGAIVIDAYANFRTPPVVVRVAFYEGNVQIISEKVIRDEV